MLNTNQKIHFTAFTKRKGSFFNLQVSGRVQLDEPVTKKQLIADMTDEVLAEFNEPYIARGEKPFWNKRILKLH